MSERTMLQVLGPDQPGIVATVARNVVDAGCNLLDVAMTRLSGEFAMLAVVESAGEFDAGRIDLGAWPGSVLAFPMRDITDEHPEGTAWSITVYGSDKPGIVAAVTEALAASGANIDDLSTRVVGEGAERAYTMLISATLPADTDEYALVSSLDDIGERLGVACHARPVDADTL